MLQSMGSQSDMTEQLNKNNKYTIYKRQFQSLGWVDPLEKEMATHSCIPAWEIPWTKEPGRVQSMGSQEWDMT